MELWGKNEVVTSYVASSDDPDDIHIKYFIQCRQSPTTAGRLPAKLNSAQLRRQTGGECLHGTDYDSAMNVHIWRKGVPGLAGGI